MPSQITCPSCCCPTHFCQSADKKPTVAHRLAQNCPKIHSSNVHTCDVFSYWLFLPFVIISSDFFILILSLIPFGMLNTFQIISHLLSPESTCSQGNALECLNYAAGKSTSPWAPKLLAQQPTLPTEDRSQLVPSSHPCFLQPRQANCSEIFQRNPNCQYSPSGLEE